MQLDVIDHLDSTELRVRGRGRDDLTALIDDEVSYEQPRFRRPGRPRKQRDDWE